MTGAAYSVFLLRFRWKFRIGIWVQGIAARGDMNPDLQDINAVLLMNVTFERRHIASSKRARSVPTPMIQKDHHRAYLDRRAYRPDCYIITIIINGYNIIPLHIMVIYYIHF
jgi:hypothetical protein